MKIDNKLYLVLSIWFITIISAVAIGSLLHKVGLHPSIYIAIDFCINYALVYTGYAISKELLNKK